MPQRRALALGALLTVALLGVTEGAAAAGPYPPPSSGSASVNPSRIKAGQCTNFSGDGFAPGAAIQVRDDGDPAGSTTANDAGRFHKRLCYRTDARTGDHVISGTGLSPEGSELTVSAVLTITGVEQSGGGPHNGSSQAVSGGTSDGASGRSGESISGGSTSAVSGDDAAADPVGSAPRTAAGEPVGGTDGFLGLSGLAEVAAFVGLLLALVAAAWLLLLLGRRRRRPDDELQPA